MKGLEELLNAHAFFEGLDPDYIALIAGCGKNKICKPGEVIAHEGDPADHFYIVREGTAAIQVFTPDKGALTLQTVGPNEIIGWSWLFPPYLWNFDVRALDLTKMIALDGKCLREKCEKNHDLGYELMKRFSQILTRRLSAARMQILDVYHLNPHTLS